HECRRRAGGHTSAARNALAAQRAVVSDRRDARIKTSAINGQGKRTLNVFTGAHTAAAHNTFGWVVGEVRVRRVGAFIQVVGAVKTVAYVAQANHAVHVLQLSIAVGGTGEAVQRVVGYV